MAYAQEVTDFDEAVKLIKNEEIKNFEKVSPIIQKLKESGVTTTLTESKPVPVLTSESAVPVSLWFVFGACTGIIISFFFKNKQIQVFEFLPGEDSRKTPITVNFKDLMK